MCPRYRVTLDEKDSTRGRARLLYEMTQGDVITDGWRSPRSATPSTCACRARGAARTVPSGSMWPPTSRSSSTTTTSDASGRPRTTPWAGSPCSHASRPGCPRLTNFVTGSRLAPLLKRLGGIAPQRDIPRFSDRTFLSWFRDRAPSGSGSRGPVMLWVDSFNNHFTPEVLRAGVTVLEDAGYAACTYPTAPSAAD